ncbi:MAG: hypothetical protein ACLR7Z_19520 [Bilophila wadsworthia]
MSASACFLADRHASEYIVTPGRYTFLDYMKAGWRFDHQPALCVFASR